MINVPIPSYNCYYFGATRFNYHDGYLNGTGARIKIEKKEYRKSNC